MARAVAEEAGVRIIGAHRGPVWPIVINRAEATGEITLFSSGQGESAYLHRWDPVSGDLIWRSTDDSVANWWVSSLAAVQGSDGRLIVAAGTEIGMFRWCGETGRLLPPGIGMTECPVYAVASSLLPGGGAMLIGGSDNGSVYRWDAASARQLGRPLPGHEGGVRAVTGTLLSDGTSVIASGDETGQVRLWDAVTGEQIGAPWSAGEEIINDLSFLELADGQLLLAACDSGAAVHRWDARTGERRGEILRLADDLASVTALKCAVINGEARVIIGDDNGHVRQWNALTGAVLPALGDGTAVDAVVDEHGSVVLAVGAQDGGIRITRLPYRNLTDNLSRTGSGHR
ncbi:WD40 repeat domain-containing protein [Streptacidiphilus jiangxiensis]|uniref:WD domain-containing protein, G-beta repeat-containing protein n=1 Tax=Streptacidiphilus jiangxiensis TaxID=235985 RepID=A0A1H7WE16_STRJI|nr:WD40 repeat domain-containing protein [Streptacidiphilus jiangxiensis]SEM19167.1 WD domain-containing protein, G-beta repeat-containing protein [Streptacidiphilus jiangxiensis]